MSDELKTIVDKIEKTIHDQRQASDELLADVKQRGHQTEDKLAKLESATSDLESRLTEAQKVEQRVAELEARVSRPSGEALKSGGVDYRAQVVSFIRTGELPDLGTRAMSAGSNADGGFTVPTEYSNEIYRAIEEFSPMRQVCRVVSLGTPDFKDLVRTDLNATANWVAETTAAADTTNPQFVQLDPVWGTAQVQIPITTQLIQDSMFDLAGYVESEAVKDIASYEGQAFVDGDASNKPKGILDYTIVETSDATRTFGQIQKVMTGQAGAFKIPTATVSQLDDLHTLWGAMNPMFFAGARWMMNQRTLAVANTWKDAEGRNILTPNYSDGISFNLLGFPVSVNPQWPAVDTDAFPIAFGNFNEAYTITDRPSTMVMMRDPYTNKPYITIYITMRVGGYLRNSNAIKVIQTGA